MLLYSNPDRTSGHAAEGTLQSKKAMTPVANQTSQFLEYLTTLRITRASTFRISFLLGPEPAALLDSEAPFVLTVLPGPPVAAQSSFQGESY